MNHSQQTPPPQHGRLSKNVDRPKGTPFFLEPDIASWDLHAIDPDRHRPSSQQQLPLGQLDLELGHAAQQTSLWPGNLQHPTAAPSTTCPLLPSWMELAMQALGMAETRPRACLSTPQQPHIARAGRHTRWSKRFFSTAAQHGVGHSLSLLNHHIHSRR